MLVHITAGFVLTRKGVVQSSSKPPKLIACDTLTAMIEAMNGKSLPDPGCVVSPSEPVPRAIASNDKTAIPVEALLRVLEGVAVALKAPEPELRRLREYLECHSTDERIDSPVDYGDRWSTESQHITRPFCEWLGLFRTADFDTCTAQLAHITLAVSVLREKARANTSVDTKTLDTVWALVQTAIMMSQPSALQFTVSRSAQGFLAVPLCSLISNGHIEELWRFHTWLPDGRRGVDEQVSIHAHNTFGQSWILLGSGTDCSYIVDRPENPSATTHAEYECCYVGADGKEAGPGYQTHQTKSIIRNTGRCVRVEEANRAIHARDASYSIPAGAYHKSIVPGDKLHATFFVFHAQRGYDENAAVLGPKDQYQYDQPRDPAGITAKTLARIVAETRIWEQCQPA
jgi:hypothetical protein